jgi:membrane-bound lytic murein transglycosylase D
MLKSQMTICLCSSFFLLPSPFDKGKFVLPPPKSLAEGKALISLSMVPKAPLNMQGMQFVRSYITKSRENLVIIKHRSTVPFNIIDSVFRHYGLPVELKYLAVIESELKPSAESHVGALGPWQLMPETAHILGLKTNPRCDERKSYYKSTKAAARYLKDLYAQFGDWLLVIAAYNGGPKPLYAAIVKSGSRNFWILQRYLPAETRQHVKKFIATQYYFEGQGSVTTLTKAESIQYAKKINAFPIAKKTVTKEASRKGKESADEKFQRLMEESEEVLQKSNQLLEESNQ